MMKKIGIFYSYRSVKTKQQVNKIVKLFGKANIQEVDADTTTGDEMMKFENWILAVPTWFDGELPNYWDELLPDLEDRDLKAKKVAVFGGGNQKDYPENFVDGLGLMADFLSGIGAKVVGSTSAEGYSFESSKALRGDQFIGLALDIENQAALTTERIEKWVEQLKKDFAVK